ncbi:MAG: hypothetical protein AB8B55_12080 [Mariniblastus sp.]
MRGTSLLTTIIVIAFSWLNQANLNAQGYAPSGVAEQLVILQNGEILRGIVSRNAEQTFVQTPLGSRLVLPNEQVDFIEATLEGAYWGKLARTKASDIEGQKQLFFWCLKHKLLDPAQNQFEILVESKISATDLENLDRQLNVALLQHKQASIRLAKSNQPTQRSTSNQNLNSETRATGEAVETRLASNTFAPIGEVDTEIFRPLPSLNPPSDDNSKFQLPKLAQSTTAGDNDFRPLPANSSSAQNKFNATASDDPDMVRQVGFEAPIVYDTISLEDKIPSKPTFDVNGKKKSNDFDPQRDDRKMIPVHELDRETRSMPKGSIGHYRRRVENVLIDKCAKCHDSNSRIMPLMKVAKGQPVPRRLSQRNHHNALKYVNRDSVFESQLLVAATQPHADLEAPIFESDEPHLRNLLIWLNMLSTNPNAVFPVPDGTTPTETQTEIGLNEAPPIDQATQPVKPEPMVDEFANSEIEFPTLTKEIPQLEASPPSFKPVDPFDPEIFNRLHRHRR